jgi:hypothetical protein
MYRNRRDFAESGDKLMIRKTTYFTSQVLRILSLVTMLSIALVPAAFSQEAVAPVRVEKEQPAIAQVKLQPKKVDMAELKRFCNPRQTTSSKRGGTTTYTCQAKPEGSTMGLQARPGAARSEINCDYSEQGGSITWLGCTCKSNDEGNCNTFITNCVEGGDDVGGNSGAATCSPPDG